MSRQTETYHNERATAGFRRENGRCGMVSMAHLACIRPGALPDVQAYDAWLADARSADPRGRSTLTGNKLRRAALMRETGSSFAEIGLALGVTSNCAR